MPEIYRKLKLCIVISPAFGMNTCYGGFYKFLQAKGYEISAISGIGECEHEQVRALGVKTHVVPIERYPRPLRDLRSLIEIWSIFRKEKFDVVQVSTPKASLLGILAARMAGQRRIMYLVRGRAYECKRGLPRFLYGCLDALCCRLADVVVPVSSSLRDCLTREHICPEAKICLIGSGSSQGVDVEAFSDTELRLKVAAELRLSFGMAPDALLVLFVGWVRREKGITELVDAIRQLRDQGERVHLLVLGDDHVPGDLDPSTQTALDIERGFHRVRWTQDTAPYYLAADIVVLPSWREGFPRVVLEAAAAGKPVVTTDVTGCRDSVEPGATGLLVPVRDTSALVQSLKRLIVDDQLRIEMGVRARQRVYSKYSQSAVWEGTELLLRRIACAQDR